MHLVLSEFHPVGGGWVDGKLPTRKKERRKWEEREREREGGGGGGSETHVYKHVRSVFASSLKKYPWQLREEHNS